MARSASARRSTRRGSASGNSSPCSRTATSRMHLPRADHLGDGLAQRGQAGVVHAQHHQPGRRLRAELGRRERDRLERPDELVEVALADALAEAIENGTPGPLERGSRRVANSFFHCRSTVRRCVASGPSRPVVGVGHAPASSQGRSREELRLRGTRVTRAATSMGSRDRSSSSRERARSFPAASTARCARGAPSAAIRVFIARGDGASRHRRRRPDATSTSSARGVR